MPSFRLKRGNSEKVNSYVGSSGELIYNTETQKVVVMDGSTPGGTALGGGGSEIIEESAVTVLKNTGQEVLLGGLIGGSGVVTDGTSIKVVNDLVVICNSDYTYRIIQNAGDNVAMLIMFSISDFEDWVANGGYVTTRPSFKSWNKSELFALSGATHVTEASLITQPCITVDPDSTVANPILWLTWSGLTGDSNPASAKFFNAGFKITGANLDNWTPCLHYPTTTPEATGHDVLPVFVDGHEGQAYNIANMNGNYSPADYNPVLEVQGSRIYVNSNLIVLKQGYIGIHIYNKSDFSYITSYSPDTAFGLSFFHPNTKSDNVAPGFASNWNYGCVNVTDDQIIAGYTNGWDYYESWMGYMLPAEVSALGADAIEAWMKINAGRLHVFNATTGAYEYSIENPDRPNLTNEDWVNFGEADNLVRYDETSGYLAVYNYSSAILGGISYPEMGGIKVFDMNNNGTLLYELSPPQDWPTTLDYSWGWDFGWFRNSDNNELLLHVAGPRKNNNATDATTPLITANLNEVYSRTIYIYNGTDGSLLKKFSYDDDPDFFLQDPPPYRSYRNSSGFTTYDNGKKVIEYIADRRSSSYVDQAVATSFGYGTKFTERKLKLSDNKFIELPLTDTFSVNYATTSQLPTALSELTNDAGFATTAQIPTALSALTNDAGFATTAQIPTALSELTNDAGLITAADVPSSNPNVVTYSTSDTIAEGDLVGLNLDGTISKIQTVEEDLPQTMYNNGGSGFQMQSGETDLVNNCYDIQNDRLVVAYQKMGSSANGNNVLTTRVGQVSNNFISFGAEIDTLDRVHYESKLIYDEYAQKVCLILNRTEGSEGYTYVMAGTVDPNSDTISWGTPTLIPMYIYKIGAAFRPSDGTLVISGMRPAYGYYAVQCRYNSGTNQYDAGTPKIMVSQTINSTGELISDVAYSLDDDEFIYVLRLYNDSLSTGYANGSLIGFAFGVSSSDLNTWSFQYGYSDPHADNVYQVTTVNTSPGDAQPKNLQLIRCPRPPSGAHLETVVCLYTVDNVAKAKTININPSNDKKLEFGTEISVSANPASMIGGVYVPSINGIVTTHQIDNGPVNPHDLTIVTVTSTLILTPGTTQTGLFASQTGHYRSYAFKPSTSQVVISYYQDRSGTTLKQSVSYLYQLATTVSTNNQADFFGIAASASSNNSVDVIVSGPVDVDIASASSSAYDLGLDPPSVRQDVFVNTLGKMTKSNTGFTIGKLIKKDVAANKFTIKL